MLGLGGGIVLVPALTLLLHLDIRYAIGASIVAVIATSSGAAAAYVRERMTNLRVAMFLELATTAGAISGAYLAGVVAGRWLYLTFGVVMGYSALAMLRKGHQVSAPPAPSRLADQLRLHDRYYDEALDDEVVYRATRPGLGLGLMYLAGTTSGLLGIGSGALKVPAMDLGMRLPIKVSTATSNFMIGVTVAASAGFHPDPVRRRAPVGFARDVPQGPAVRQGIRTRGERAELIISRLLRGGVLISLALVVVGTVVSFVHHPEYFRSTHAYHRLTAWGADPPHSLGGVAAGVRHLRGQAIVALGLLVLIATPVTRVAVSTVLFLKRGDRTFVGITLVVLSLLLASFVLGKAGG